jgi:hypothetical protein
VEAKATPPAFPPLAKGGPGEWGASDVAAKPLMRSKRREQPNVTPHTFPPLKKGGQGG